MVFFVGLGVGSVGSSALAPSTASAFETEVFCVETASMSLINIT